MAALNYKCPNCTAALVFDSKTQKMKCEYCEGEFSVEDLEALKEDELSQEQIPQEESGWDNFRPEEWQSCDMEGMRIWNCSSCGAEIVAEETLGSMKCPYCDNAMIMPEQFGGMYLPDYIIPFKKSKKEAMEALKAYYSGKPLLPKIFKDENHMEEIKPVYVPFWLFDLGVSAKFRYEGVKIHTYKKGEYRYTVSRFYEIMRKGSMKFQRIPVDGSRRIDDTTMEAIEPYDYKELEEFKISYLSGYLANKYDVEPDELTNRVHERIQQSVRNFFRESVMGYDTVLTKKEQVYIQEKGAVKYALLPVWFLNTKWNGKMYSFAMNGQTGRLIGDLPVGKEMVVRYWIKRHLSLTAVLTALGIVLRLLGVI